MIYITTLIYPSGAFSLSIRDSSDEHGDIVKHYKIRSLDSGGFYISPSLTFTSLPQLIKHYSSESIQSVLSSSITPASQFNQYFRQALLQRVNPISTFVKHYSSESIQ